MSSIQNVITTTFRAQGSQAIAQMGSVAQGFGNVGRAIYGNTQMSERLNSQWRAMGTTNRYSISGSGLFGLTRMVGQLRDVQQQLGLIQAIGSKPGGGIFGQSLSTKDVDAMGNALRQAAVNSLTPVNELNDATVNLLSTVQNVRPSEVPGIIQNIAEAAKIAQTPVEDLTKAAATMNVQFQRTNSVGNIQQFTRMWFALIKTAPGGPSAAPEIAQQLPSLGSIVR